MIWEICDIIILMKIFTEDMSVIFLMLQNYENNIRYDGVHDSTIYV